MLEAGRVPVIYGSDRSREDHRFFLVDVRSDNGKSFMAGELYYKLYCEVAGELAARRVRRADRLEANNQSSYAPTVGALGGARQANLGGKTLRGGVRAASCMAMIPSPELPTPP